MKTIKHVTLIVLLLGNVGFIGALNLPTARVTIEVVDEEGRPVSGADTGFSLYTEDPLREGVTDKQGRYTGEGRTRGHVMGGVRADGYYDSGFTFKLDSTVPPGVQVRRRYPDYTHRVVIRRIVNPVPMYAYRFSSRMPVDGEEVGFDFLKADWVAPHGRGEVADVLVRITTYDPAKLGPHRGEISWRFPNPGDGMIRIPPEDWHEDSWFRAPRTAPASGYIAEWRSVKDPNIDVNKRTEPPGPDFLRPPYFVRIRSEMNERGEVIRAMYGRIDADGTGSITWNTAHLTMRAGLRFTYYINPDGTRNLESDPNRNLFREIYPRVSLPQMP